MATRKIGDVSRGVTVPAPCPICGGALRWTGQTWHLTCGGCNLAVTLDPDEARDLAWHLAMPGLQDTPLELFLSAVLQRHYITGAVITPDPTLVGTQADGGFKWRVLPGGAETGAQRAARLSEQALVNGVTVQAENSDWTLFRVSSQRRGADGQPLCWYAVRITALEARCSCQATGLCAHLAAAHTWLLDQQVTARLAEQAAVAWNSKTPEARWAEEDALIAELWG